jgi:subtilisin family serine protease
MSSRVGSGSPETTGRFLVLLPEDQGPSVHALEDSIGAPISSTADLPPDALAAEHLTESPAIVLSTLGVAIVSAPPAAMRSYAVAAEATREGPGVLVEPERVVYALEGVPVLSGDLPGPLGAAPSRLSADYLRGYRDAVVHLSTVGGVGDHDATLAPSAATTDQSSLTWGLQATGVGTTSLAGQGVKLAVLDTGFDLDHPDFVGRTVTAQSFVAGEQVDDVVGHGTHCIGTACGPRDPATLPRYGVACSAEIHVGKVLNNRGRGVDGDILAGIEWAIASGCAVISMSLGAPTQKGQAYSRIFERAATRALARGTLIVAAAGNDSHRDLGTVRPVSHPANCPSIMAVGAVDQSLETAYFSNGGSSAAGGQVDIAAPGVGVRSSWPMPRRYNTISGTSMATPHVAGIAALAAGADPVNRGTALWSLLQRGARRLPAASSAVGAGLVQAP